MTWQNSEIGGWVGAGKPSLGLGGGGAIMTSPQPTTQAKSSGSGKWKAPKMTAPKVKQPKRPKLPKIDPQAPFDPTLESYRDRYGGHLTNLEEGTGYSMDVLRQGQQDSMEAEIMRMRAAADQAGIPFDEGQARAELQRGVNASMAQEKLGREAMMTQAYGTGKDIYALPPEERNKRLEMDLRRDVAEAEGVLDLYGRDIQRYGMDVNAAVAANQSLMSFYNNLMSGMFSAMSPSMGGYSSSVYYG